MVEQRTSRGVPLPSVGQMTVIAAALVAAWLVWSGFGRIGGDFDDAAAGGNPVRSFQAVESSLNQGTAAVPELLAALDSDDPQECSRAAYGLGRLGPTATAALDKLVVLLAADSPRVRGYAAFAVARIQPDKEAAAAAIAPLLADAVTGVRDDAAKELLEIGGPAFEPTVQLLQTGDVSVRLSVVQVLKTTRDMAHRRRWAGAAPKVLQVVRGLLDDADPAVRIEALALLAEWNQASPAEVGELLRHAEPLRVVVGLRAVGRLNSGAAQLLPDILNLFDRLALEEVGAARGRVFDERIGAVLSALSSLRTAARSAAPRLLKLFGKCKDRYWVPIAHTLVDVGADPQDVVRILSPLLLHENRGRTIASQAGELLLKISPTAARGQVSLLIPKLADAHGAVDKSVLYALYALGPQARAAIPALIPLLHDSDPWVAEFAANTFSQLGQAGVGAVAELTRVVKNGGMPSVQRLACVNALASMGAGAQGAVPALLQLLEQAEPNSPISSEPPIDIEWRLRSAVVRALGQIGGDAPELMLALRVQFSSRSPDIRASAADAVSRVAGQVAGQSAPGLGDRALGDRVLVDLVALLGDENPKVRATAALSISRVAAGRSTAIPALFHALADEDFSVQKAAVVSFGRIGPAAGDALPLLRAILANPRNALILPLQTCDIPELDSLSLAQAAQAAVTAIARKAAKDGT